MSKLALQYIIQKIESARETQTEIDNIYTNLCDVIIAEMDNLIPCFDTIKKTNQRFKASKPYWNGELRELWNTMYAKEKLFLKLNGRTTSVKS